MCIRDRNLGAWVSRQLGRPLELWNGACHVHMELSLIHIFAADLLGVPVP